MSEHLQYSFDEVDDPVVAHFTARVETGFLSTIEREAGLRDLHDQGGSGKMICAVVCPSARNHREIRLRL